MEHIEYVELHALAFMYSCTMGQVCLLVCYLLYKAEMPSVCLSVHPSASRDNLSGFSMDRLKTWFVQS